MTLIVTGGADFIGSNFVFCSLDSTRKSSPVNTSIITRKNMAKYGNRCAIRILL